MNGWKTKSARTVACTLLFVFCAYAGYVSPDAVSDGGGVTRDLQLREIGLLFHPGVRSYLGVNINYFPLPSQSKLNTEYGSHEGYVFRQNFAGYFGEEIGHSGIDLGVLWWIERHGWDSEDFVLFPRYGEFSLVRSVQTAGIALSRPKWDLGFAGGIQYTNPEIVQDVYRPETDTLYEWGAAAWGPVSAQTSFRHADFRHVRVSLNLESKQARKGHASGPLTYLPNIDVALYDRNSDGDDSLRIFWEQNLYKQRLYAEAAVYFPDKNWRFAALKFYPDPSKVVSFDLTCYRKDGGDILWGGGVTMPFFRLAYNHADDIENLFGLRGTFIIQLHFGIERIYDKFLGLNGSRAAPMETRETDPEEGEKKKKRDERQKENMTSSATKQTGEAKKPVREITATGIVRKDIP